jgi:hypothetical protein
MKIKRNCKRKSKEKEKRKSKETAKENQMKLQKKNQKKKKKTFGTGWWKQPVRKVKSAEEIPKISFVPVSVTNRY